MPKPRELDVQTRLIFHERIVPVGPDGLVRSSQRSGSATPMLRSRGGSLKVVRHVVQAAAAINGEVRPTAASLRPEVALLVAEKRDRGWPVDRLQSGRAALLVRAGARAGGGRPARTLRTFCRSSP